MRIVQKYGGTSLENGDRILRAAQRAAALAKQGHEVVLVVSAQGDTTDVLLEQAAGANPRERDAYLAVGELLSAGRMAMTLEGLGCEAVSLAGWQAGLHTDDVHGNARILGLDSSRILRELSAGRTVVVAGFQGVDSQGNVTTLGRGGSDTTAVALAAFLQAGKCQIFTDVDGVYDRDPRKFPQAKKYDRISWEEMAALAAGGAQVLHDRSVELARQYGVTMEVCSALEDVPGTLVGGL